MCPTFTGKTLMRHHGNALTIDWYFAVVDEKKPRRRYLLLFLLFLYIESQRIKCHLVWKWNIAWKDDLIWPQVLFTSCIYCITGFSIPQNRQGFRVRVRRPLPLCLRWFYSVYSGKVKCCVVASTVEVSTGLPADVFMHAQPSSGLVCTSSYIC